MPSTPPADSVSPVEPTPSVAPAAPVVPPPPPYVDPYAQVTPPTPPTPGYAPAYQAGYYAAPQQPRGLAIAALITGIGGAFFSFAYGLGLLPSIAAIITGHLARKRQPHAGGMALAGLICGYIGLAISVLVLLGVIFFVAFVASNPTYNSDF